MQLVRFLMKMTSEYVQIELKDGTVVAGTVASVTPNMNTVLKDVKMKTAGEDPLVMDSITLRGNSIRYFVLPDAINLDAMIGEPPRKLSTVAPSRKRSHIDAARGGREKLARVGRGHPRGPVRAGGASRGGRGAPRGAPRGGPRGGFRGGPRGRGRGRGRGGE